MLVVLPCVHLVTFGHKLAPTQQKRVKGNSDGPYTYTITTDGYEIIRTEVAL